MPEDGNEKVDGGSAGDNGGDGNHERRILAVPNRNTHLNHTFVSYEDPRDLLRFYESLITNHSFWNDNNNNLQITQLSSPSVIACESLKLILHINHYHTVTKIMEHFPG